MNGYANQLYVETWGGGHAAAVSNELLVPFARETGVQIEQRAHSVSGDSRYPAGIVELGLHDAIKACDDGDLLFLPADLLSKGNNKAIRDFVPNSLQPCSIGHSIWSTVLTFDASRFTESDRPVVINDFFNVEDYPGRRVLRKSPMVLAEWSLVASGIATSRIYRSLAQTDLAWGLIANKLSDIAQAIVWVDTDEQALEYIRSGEAAFAMVGSESVIRSRSERRAELGVLWDAAFTEVGMWGIPTDAPDPQLALEFLQYATSGANNARIASVFGYAPVRYSTLKMVERGYRQLLPSWPANQTNPVWGDIRWWRDHGDNLRLLFSNWADVLESQLTLASGEVYDVPAGSVGSNAIVDARNPFMPLPATSVVIGKF